MERAGERTATILLNFRKTAIDLHLFRLTLTFRLTFIVRTGAGAKREFKI